MVLHIVTVITTTIANTATTTTLRSWYIVCLLVVILSAQAIPKVFLETLGGPLAKLKQLCITVADT